MTMRGCCWCWANLYVFVLFALEGTITESFTAFVNRFKPANGHFATSSRLYTRSFANTVDSAMEVADNFPRTWVPLCSSYELNPQRPNSVYFLGKEYIVYRNDDESWTVCDSICPHRLAPLREGRINEHNHLECSYHGWSFDGSSGLVQQIPQLPVDQLTPGTQKKCSLGTYTTVVEKNIIWAWLWPDNDNSLQFKSTPEYQLRGVIPNATTYTRDLPYSYDTLLENIVDPSHVPWAHHGLQGNRKDAVPINLTMTSPVTMDGFTFAFRDRTMGMYREGTGEFRAPFVMEYAAEFEAKSGDTTTAAPPRTFNLTTIMIPTKPGWSRIILFGSSRERNQNNMEKGHQQSNQRRRKQSLFSIIFRLMPVWLLHQLNNRFLDSDMAFLHYQEIARKSKMSYIMPAQADRCVSALRAWIDDYYNVPAAFQSTKKTSLERSILFDHMTQHTNQCKHCTLALSTVKKWRLRTYVIMALSVLFSKTLPARLILATSLLAMPAYNAIESALEKGDYKHYEKS